MKIFFDLLLRKHYFSCSEEISSINAMKLGWAIKFDVHKICKSDKKYNLESRLGSKNGTVIRYDYGPDSKFNSKTKELTKTMTRPLADASHLKFLILLSLPLSIKLTFYFLVTF